MNKYLIPNEIFKSIDDLSGEFFKEKGIKAVFLDIDNTLVTPHTPLPDERAKRFFNSLKESGIIICLISNNNKERVSLFNEDGFLSSHRSAKPLTFAYRKMLKKTGLKKEDVAAVGDQFYSDILGANILGLYTIYVSPIQIGGEGAFVHFKRKLEKNVIKKLGI